MIPKTWWLEYVVGTLYPALSYSELLGFLENTCFPTTFEFGRLCQNQPPYLNYIVCPYLYFKDILGQYHFKFPGVQGKEIWSGRFGTGSPIATKCVLQKKKQKAKKWARTGPGWTEISAFWTDISAFRTGLVDAPKIWNPKNAFRGKKSSWTVLDGNMGHFNHPLVHHPCVAEEQLAIQVAIATSCYPSNIAPPK